MKSEITTIALLSTLLLACESLPSTEDLAEMNLEERWSYLEEGQAVEDVHYLLGTPIQTIERGNIRLDQYDCALCLTKIDKNRGLLAWNPPVKGFEGEADLLTIGGGLNQLPAQLIDGVTSIVGEVASELSEVPEASQRAIEETLDGLFEGLERLQGDEGQELRTQLSRSSEELARLLGQFLEEHADEIGDGVEQLIQLQQQLLEEGIEEHGETLKQYLEELSRAIKEAERKKEAEEFVPIFEPKEKTAPNSDRAKQWAALQKGMTQKEVVALLGRPTEQNSWAGQITYTFECHNCTVTFNERGRVWAWNSPGF
jgi:outer membrane protein assembly factor BamE (lipoprotein component of BamABCDE complex)